MDHSRKSDSAARILDRRSAPAVRMADVGRALLMDLLPRVAHRTAAGARDCPPEVAHPPAARAVAGPVSIWPGPAAPPAYPTPTGQTWLGRHNTRSRPARASRPSRHATLGWPADASRGVRTV